jgi:hypothetical protein
VVERRADDDVHARVVHRVPVGDAVEDLRAGQARGRSDAEEVLHVADERLLVGEALRDVADDAEPVAVGRRLERADARDVEAVVGLDAGEPLRGDPGDHGLGVLGSLEDDGVLPPCGGAAHEGTAGEDPRAREALAAEALGRGDGRAVDVAGVADARHAVRQVEEAHVRREGERVVGREMRVQVDQAGHHERALELAEEARVVGRRGRPDLADLAAADGHRLMLPPSGAGLDDGDVDERERSACGLHRLRQPERTPHEHREHRGAERGGGADHEKSSPH